MGKVVAFTIVTLDGVMQAPARPDEDTRGGFEYGGWATPYADPVMGSVSAESGSSAGALLFGRRTYEALAGLPQQARDASWHWTTELSKVVFSATLKTVSWPNTRICRDDLITEVSRLKGESDVPLRTMGSLSVARQLLSAGLVDRLRDMLTGRAKQ